MAAAGRARIKTTLSAFRISARSLIGTSPTEWWTNVDTATISTDPGENGGLGSINPPTGGGMSTPGPGVSITLPALSAEWNLFVSCYYAGEPLDHVEWGSDVPGSTGGGRAQLIEAPDAADVRWGFTIPAATSAPTHPKQFSVSGIDHAGKLDGALVFCDVLPFT